LPRVDYLVGGFPCQDLSSAGKRVGIDGDRSGLWREFIRLVDELRPRGVVLENVHHAWRQWVPVLRRALWEHGYASLPIRLRASDFGAWHERSRVFLVAHIDPSILRLESWRREWPNWEDPPLFADAAQARHAHGEGFTATERRRHGGVVADADALWQLQPEGRESDEWRRAGDGGWWTTEPDVVRVVHGVSSRLDGRRMAARIGALGNAVVPPEVLWIARRLIEAEAETRRR
jgi:DNA (cytosine-5)-methyltransferase 1